MHVEHKTWLHSVLENSPIPLFVIDQHHRVIYWSRACEAVTRVPADQVLGTQNHWHAFYDSPHPCLADAVLDGADVEKLRKHYGTAVRPLGFPEKNFEGEDYFPKLGKWLLFTAAPIYDADGHIIGAVESVQDFTHRHASEQTLSESEGRLRSILNGSPIPLFVIDRDHRVTHWNRAYEEMTGISAEEMIGTRNHWQVFYDTPRPCLVDLLLDGVDSEQSEKIIRYYGSSIRRSASSEEALEGEGYFPKLGKWLLFTAVPIRDTHGHIIAAMESIQDLTRRKTAEHALTESETRLRHILDSSPIPQFVIDSDHRVTHWNHACELMTNIPARQIVGTQDHWRAFYDSPRPCLVDVMLEGQGPDAIAEYYGTTVRPQGLHRPMVFEGEGHFPKLSKWLSFTAALICNSHGKRVAAIESLQDITARKETERTLRRSEARFRGLFEDMPNVAMYGYGLDGIIRYWNKASERLYGYVADEIIGQSFLDRLIVQGVRRETFAFMRDLVAGHAAGCQQEAYRIHKDGRHVPVLSSYAVVSTPDHDTELYCLDVDLTEQQEAQEQLRLAASVFEHAHEGIMITDAIGNIVAINQTFSDMTGYTREEAIGQNPRILKSGRQNHAFYSGMWQALTDRGYWHGEIWNRRKNGDVFPEIASISAVRNPENAITHFVGLFADISALKENQERLERMAFYDPLTRLPNRSLLTDRLRQAIAKAQRKHRVLAVCYLDLDGFKPVNDQWGHAMGDALLIQVAERLLYCMRTTDTVARLGGDEFVVLFDDLHSVDDAERILQRISEMFVAPFLLERGNVKVSASIGATFFPPDVSDPDILIRHADQAMYAAKQRGRNCYQLFDLEQDRQTQTHRELLEHVRQGLEKGEFVLYYQPKVDMKKGQVVGAEALIRWKHPQKGILSPGIFMPAVDSSPFAETLGNWVLAEAMRQMGVWSEQGLRLSVSVNISGRHLQQPDFTEAIQTLLQAYPTVQPNALELEILETAALDKIDQVSRVITDCRAMGVRFSLDDFGTGYCSLAYLKHLPAQVLKIDQSFVRNMQSNPGDLAIVRGVIGMAAAFKLEVIAEGVETLDHGVLLLELGCHRAQGYAIARPMPAEDLERWVQIWRIPEEWKPC